MRTARSNGFIMVSVIVVLGLMAVVMLVLAEGTQTMLWQTDRMYLAAVETNLVSSGAAWASVQLSANRLPASGQVTELDAKSFSDRPCQLSIRLLGQSGDQTNVQISTSCSKSRWTFEHSRTYAILP
jgi:hypothetical protein